MNLSFRKKKPVPEPEQEKPWVMVANEFDVDKELELSPIPVGTKQVKDPKTGKVETHIKMVSAGNVFSGVSIEDALSKGYGATVKYWNYYISTGVLRKCINMIANFTTRAGFETTIDVLDKNDNPERPEYIAAKETIDEINRRVNLDYILLITQIKRNLHGNCAWEIVPSNDEYVVSELKPLRSSYLIPEIDDDGNFLGVRYSGAMDEWIPVERLLYFNVDSLENDRTSLLGISTVRSIERNIKIKKNLERDLLYAARAMWAPIIIYEADTRGLTPGEKATLFNNLKTDLRPGATVITNRAVIPHVTQYRPDLNSLIRAQERQDEEIIGNYGIPKALLSRERTMARATLEFSIRAFYESTVAGEQAYLKRQLERQWYDPITQELGLSDKIRIRHEWRPIIDPQSDLVVALIRGFEAGVINSDEFFRRLGWELDRVEPGAAPPEVGNEEQL